MSDFGDAKVDKRGRRWRNSWWVWRWPADSGYRTAPSESGVKEAGMK